MEKRICVDMKEAQEYLKVRNSYTDKRERDSFSITAVVCEDESEGCTDD